MPETPRKPKHNNATLRNFLKRFTCSGELGTLRSGSELVGNAQQRSGPGAHSVVVELREQVGGEDQT